MDEIPMRARYCRMCWSAYANMVADMVKLIKQLNWFVLFLMLFKIPIKYAYKVAESSATATTVAGMICEIYTICFRNK